MIGTIKKILQQSINKLGFKISKSDYIINNDLVFQKIYNICKDYTMTSKEKMYALYKSVEYVIKAKIPGDFVECGVWKGGSTMLIALTLQELDTTDRKIYLYDTFEGMSEPSNIDMRISNQSISAFSIWKKKQRQGFNQICYSGLSEVQKNMYNTAYPKENLIFIKGKVENTIPDQKPNEIALLRLDTDWYESTKHELIHLFPILKTNGILILDDYGYWAGAKKAVDEYFSDLPILLNRIDNTGRLAIKITE